MISNAEYYYKKGIVEGYFDVRLENILDQDIKIRQKFLLGYKEGKIKRNNLTEEQLSKYEDNRMGYIKQIGYLVGYNEKRVLSYIKKLNKAFKDLPYDKGVAIGFSMIEDDLKLVGDAINEATEKMKNNKVLMQGDTNEKEI